MPMLQPPKRLLAAAVTSAFVLVFASSAFGCVAFRGKLVVQGDRTTNVVTAIGSTNGMNWCAGYPLGKTKASRGGTVTLTVSKNPADSCAAGARLASGTYLVNYANGAAFQRSAPDDKSNADGSRGWVIDCAFPSVVETVNLGTMEIDALGKGSGTYTLPADGVASGPTDEAAICVSDPLNNVGNQAPVTVI